MKLQAASIGHGKRLLMSVAESIGSALGTIAAKANVIEGLARTPETDPQRPGASKAVLKGKRSRRAASEHRKLASGSSRASRKTTSGGRAVRTAKAKSRA
jgi:hypothetical protein